jgi:cytochrome c553
LVATLAVALFFGTAVEAQTSGQTVFEARCKDCHEPAADRAPSRADLAQRPQTEIVKSLTDGLMKLMADGLSAAEIQAVASYISSVDTLAPATTTPAPATRMP